MPYKTYIFCIRFFIAIITFGVFGQVNAQISLEKEFKLFSDSLVNAVNERDTAFIFNRVDPDVMNGLGDRSGKDRFKELWYDSYTHLRLEMIKALSLGGAFSEYGNRVYVPHHWVTFPDSLDAYYYAYPLTDFVKVYRNPVRADTAIAIIRQKWIKVFDWSEGDEIGQQGHTAWIGVITANQDSAYVMADEVRSPLDYRFWFEKKDNKWTLMGWAAGD